MSIELSDIPTRSGIATGRYRLRRGNVTGSVRGARFVDGVTIQPVEGRRLRLLRSCYGSSLVIEPWDAETLDLIVQHLRSRDQGPRATEVARVFRHLRSKPKKAAAA